MSLSKLFFNKSASLLFIALSLCFGAAVIMSGCTVRPLYGEKTAKNTAAAHMTAGSDSLAAASGRSIGAAAAQNGQRRGNSVRAELAAIAIDEQSSRFGQIVRNRLIYLLAGGTGEPASPRYRLTLNAGYAVQQAVQVNIGDTTEREGRASSGTVVASADYVLRTTGSGSINSAHSGSADASKSHSSAIGNSSDNAKRSGDESGAIVQQRKRSVTASFDRPRQEYANLQAEEDAKKRAAEELAESIYLSLAQALGSQSSADN